SNSPRQLKHRTRRLRPEYGVGDFLDHIAGLARAARKVQQEEQLLLRFDQKGKAVNWFGIRSVRNKTTGGKKCWKPFARRPLSGSSALNANGRPPCAPKGSHEPRLRPQGNHRTPRQKLELQRAATRRSVVVSSREHPDVVGRAIRLHRPVCA